MSTFKELQEEYVKNSNKTNTLNISKDQKYYYLYPIKIEKVNDEYHLFIMLEYRGEIFMSFVNKSNYTINKLVFKNLFIDIPLDKFNLDSNTIIIDGFYSYIMDGSKLNIDMLNYLR
jgi:hypothetical protein